MVLENPLDLFFAAFTVVVATMLFFGVLDRLPTQIIYAIVVLMFVSAFLDIIA